MNPAEYQKLALRTMADQKEALENLHVINTISNNKMMQLMHGAVGASTEAGEQLSLVEKVVWFGKPLDEKMRMKMLEEIGDKLWYTALELDALGSSFEEVMEANIRKLRARYPERFSLELSENRDVSKEEQALKGE